ncbi:MAG: tetratricopeptide repeat protein [Gammaproteobacteria bacterium]|nr:tetratricopeptide repeat protein [Gammaproteobacteria bacterium]
MNFASIVANDPTNAAVHRLLAETRVRVQTPQQTLPAMEPALTYFSRATSGGAAAQSVEAQLEIASGNLIAGEFSRAIGLLQAMPSGAATGYQREYLLVLALLRSGAKEKKTIADGKTLLERSGKDPAAHNLVGGLFAAAVAAAASGNRRGAEEWLVKAVADHPDSTEARLALAEIRQRNGNVGSAIEICERGLTAAPGNSVLLNNLAVLYQAQGNPKAVEAAGRAYRAAPRVPAIKDTYGWILLGAGKTEQALDLLRDAAAAMPDNAEVQYHCAVALAKSGDEAVALSILRKALEGELPAEAGAGAQKLIEELSG